MLLPSSGISKSLVLARMVKQSTNQASTEMRASRTTASSATGYRRLHASAAPVDTQLLSFSSPKKMARDCVGYAYCSSTASRADPRADGRWRWAATSSATHRGCGRSSNPSSDGEATA